jgi:hypothetical protein
MVPISEVKSHISSSLMETKSGECLLGIIQVSKGYLEANGQKERKCGVSRISLLPDVTSSLIISQKIHRSFRLK